MPQGQKSRVSRVGSSVFIVHFLPLDTLQDDKGSQELIKGINPYLESCCHWWEQTGTQFSAASSHSSICLCLIVAPLADGQGQLT